MDEIELKLELTEAGAKALTASSLLAGRPRRAVQRSVYFDTPDRRLAASGLSLRIRAARGARVQTVKQAGPAAAGLFQRPEWECPVPGDIPRLDERTPLPGLLAEGAAPLAPVFTVSVTRRTWVVTHAGARIEVVIDQGEITAADRRCTVGECELELLEGPPAALFALARDLGAAAALRLGVLTKSERGYRLIGPAPTAIKAEPVALDPDLTAAEAFQRIARSCLRQFRLNEDLLRASRAAEPLHQARVALRRLRSALSVFRPLHGTHGDALQQELRWLAQQLADARDLDVLLARAPAGPLQDRLRAAREAACDSALQQVESQRARRLMLDLAEWLAQGAWLTDPDHQAARDQAAGDFAALALSRLRRKLRLKGAALADLDDETRHDLRKDAKKLRYAADFFAPLLAGRHPKRRKRFAAGLEAFQDRMGALNDLVAGPLVLERLGLLDLPGVESLLDRTDRDRLLAAAERSHAALMAARRYW